MRAEVFEESLALRIGLLEALPLSGGDHHSYPFPSLATTSAVEEREFLAVVIENTYLRLTILPALGGRILRILDKRTATDLLPLRDVLAPVVGGPRGVTLPDGIQFRLTNEDRLNALGTVAYQIDAAQDDEEDAGVWLAESSMAKGLSWHLRISLPPDRAEIHFHARILNRTFKGVPYNSGLTLDKSSWATEGELAFAGDQQLSRFDRETMLGPRQVDSWTMKVAPGPCSIAGNLRMGDDLSIQVNRPIPSAKVLLLTSGDETLEARFDLYPEHPTQVPLNGIVPKAVVVQGIEGTELIRWPALPPAAAPPPDYCEPLLDRFVLGGRHLAHTLKGIEALGAKDFEQADEEFEQALLYNGDDPLLWWAKAIAQRKMASEGDQVELPNAHFLAPLEPALRAEAFLSQSSQQGKDANPLVKTLSPEDLVEIACLLLEHLLPDEATRWIDEALRHQDLAMLHYLQADALLQGTRMETEAAHHVVQGAKAQLPPNPWRSVELEALERLAKRFPTDERLRKLCT
ncbi:MAG: DUF5107 domain-containing protein [Fimbriimonas sp.]